MRYPPRSMRAAGAIPPPWQCKRGISAILARYHMKTGQNGCETPSAIPLRLPNALNSEDRGLKVRFSLAMIVFETFELILCQMLSSQGKNAPSNPYPHYLVRLSTSRSAILSRKGMARYGEGFLALGRQLHYLTLISHPRTGRSSQPPRSKPLRGLKRAIVVL